MKRIISSALFMLITLTIIDAQGLTGPITLEKKGHRYVYLNDGKSVTPKELNTLLKENSASSGAFKTFKTDRIIGNSLLIGGTAIIAVGFLFELKSASTVEAGDISTTDAYSKTGGALLVTGALVMAGSLPFMFMSSSSFKKSINLYNSSMHSKTGTSMRIDLGFTGNGVRLAMRF
jgi:hypothetical protein